MPDKVNRREFLGTLGTAAVALSPLAAGFQKARAGTLAQGVPVRGVARVAPKARIHLELFDYEGVRLRPSRLLRQYEAAREYYLSVPDDDILKGFYEMAAMKAPGEHLGGWAARSSSVVFGQWLQAMARAYRATDDTALRDKAVRLVEGYERTVGAEGNPNMDSRTSTTNTYPYEKLVGGLLDLDRYGDYRGARTLLERIIDWGIANLDRTRRAPSNRGLGTPTEWYTMPENMYRAFQWRGDDTCREFAEVWHYDSYWDRFIESSRPENIAGLHAYSHVNTFSSAAKAYEVTGDAKYLAIIKNAYAWLQRDQCYASGGYGPDEFMMAPDGSLGRSLERSVRTFETPCGSWAGFKLSKYLMRFTGESRYGDWIERLLYNGIGAALPMATGGQTFYYSNYNLGSGTKSYYHAVYPCCAGTYFQAVVEYGNLIYLRDSKGLYVNLYVPSEVAWKLGGEDVTLVQETDYPEGETSTIKLELKRDMEFPLKFRVPAWARGVTIKVNSAAQQVTARPGTWAELSRTWKTGDAVEIRIPLRFRKSIIDAQHPGRAAVMCGPLMLAQEAPAGSTVPTLPADDQLEKWLAAADTRGIFRVTNAPVGSTPARFKPFYLYGNDEPYRVYFD